MPISCLLERQDCRGDDCRQGQTARTCRESAIKAPPPHSSPPESLESLEVCWAQPAVAFLAWTPLVFSRSRGRPSRPCCPSIMRRWRGKGFSMAHRLCRHRRGQSCATSQKAVSPSLMPCYSLISGQLLWDCLPFLRRQTKATTTYLSRWPRVKMPCPSTGKQARHSGQDVQSERGHEHCRARHTWSLEMHDIMYAGISAPGDKHLCSNQRRWTARSIPGDRPSSPRYREDLRAQPHMWRQDQLLPPTVSHP